MTKNFVATYEQGQEIINKVDSVSLESTSQEILSKVDGLVPQFKGLSTIALSSSYNASNPMLIPFEIDGAGEVSLDARGNSYSTFISGYCDVVVDGEEYTINMDALYQKYLTLKFRESFVIKSLTNTGSSNINFTYAYHLY